MGDGRQDGRKSSQDLKPPCAPSGFLGGPDSKESAYNAEDRSSLPGEGGSPEEGNGKPLQDSCLGNPMDRGAWWAAVYGVTKSQTQQSN